MRFSSLSVFALLALSGCVINSADSTDAGAPDPEAKADAGGGSTLPPADGTKLPFAPSNVAQPSFKDLDEVTISSNCTLNTDSGTIGCLDPKEVRFGYAKVEQGQGASQVAVFAMRSLRIQPSAILRVKGSLPLVLLTATNSRSSAVSMPPAPTMLARAASARA